MTAVEHLRRERERRKARLLIQRAKYEYKAALILIQWMNAPKKDRRALAARRVYIHQQLRLLNHQLNALAGDTVVPA